MKPNSERPRKTPHHPPPMKLDEPISCENCSEQFETNIAFAYHSLTHNEDGKYSCHLCQYRTSYRRKKKIKIKKEPSQKKPKLPRQEKEKFKKEPSPLPELVKLEEPRKCDDCNVEFDYDVDFAVHSIKHSKDNKYTCHLCPNYQNIRRDRMELHIRRHDNPKKRGRPPTGRQPKIKKSNLNGDKYKKTPPPDPVILDEPIKCKNCEQTFFTNLHYALHSIEHSAELKYTCHICNFTNLRKDRFELHVRLHEGSTKYKCEICQKAFRCGAHADEHRNFHTGEKPFQCEICGKHFMYSRGLGNHRIKTHCQILTGKPREKFRCEFCDKEFESSTGLTSHTNIKHRNIQPDISVICEICGKRISCMGRLKYHLRVHSGDKPYACLMCPKRFAMRDLLIEHSRVHTGEKPYVCKYCGKTFGQRSPYRYHIKTHTGEKPYLCPICGKGFISKAGMKSHLKNCFKP
uniref:Zinc finger protein 28-like n=1 Tax=Diabrotica virgifera virgifera TaxID=50390 RepID=A0A6P7F5J9_DIAVI